MRGRSAHAGRNPEDGRNAIVAAADLALRLAMREAPGLAVNPARIEGGGPNNVVPDLAILRVNLRPRTPDDQADAQALIDDAVARSPQQHDVDDRGARRLRPPAQAARRPKPKRCSSWSSRPAPTSASRSRWQPTGGVCDGNNIAACGVPVVDTMGVRGGKIHSAEEYLIVDSLAERAALSALTILRLAGEAA